MPTEVIVPISDGREGLVAGTALVWLLAGVDAHVDKQVAALVELLLAEHAPEAGRKWITAVHYDILTISRLLGRPLVLVGLSA